MRTEVLLKAFCLILLSSFLILLNGCKQEATINESQRENYSSAIHIAVKDMTPPTIKCKDSFTITVGESFDLRNHIEIIDNIDKDISYECVGSYNAKAAGQYIVQIKAVDRAGNKASKNISLTVLAASSSIKEKRQEIKQEHTPAKPQIRIKSQDFLYADGYSMSSAVDACSTSLHASGKSGSCDPIQNENGIYTGMRLNIYD